MPARNHKETIKRDHHEIIRRARRLQETNGKQKDHQDATRTPLRHHGQDASCHVGSCLNVFA